MIITQDFDALPQKPRVFALGNFDGVHRGHQALLSHAVNLARQQQGAAIAMGFNPHPLAVLGQTVETITTERDKQRLFARLGLDAYFALPFNKEVAKMTPADFVQQVLIEQAKVAAVVVGFNYSFGRKAAGTPEYLQQTLGDQGVPVHVIPPVIHEGAPVSSTRIRQCLRAGDLCTVEALLGRPYSITGVVQLGDQRGRHLGFPTANLYGLEGLALPPFGVYAAEIVGLGIGMANLGVRPTFPQSGATLEVHIFDFTGDLYGQELEVRLLKHIRPEQHFATGTELKRQLSLDEEQIRALLKF